MSESFKKAVLTKSGCNFNIDGMKLFRFHSYSDTDFLSHEEIPDTHENCLSFILCSTGKIRIQLLNGQIISACQQDVVCISEKVNLSLFETEREASGFLLIAESPKIQNSLWKITKIMGNWNLDIHSAIQYTEQIGGRYLIRNNLWVFSLFSVLDVLDDTEQDCYCVWKCIELLYLLSQKMIQVQQVEMLQKNGSVHDRLRSVCSYMELHLDEKMTIDSLCRRFYLSPTTFKRYFRSVYDQPVHSWLLQKRMEKAGELLRYSSMTVLEIAQSVGYSSLSQFNVVFKKYYHCTPREYRNRSDSVSFCLFPKE